MLAAHIAMFSLQKELLWPFFNAESSPKKHHEDYAKTRCKFQIDYLLHEVLPEIQGWLPRLHGDEIPKWLGRVDPQRSLDRVTGMLVHLETILDARDLHKPLYFGHHGRSEGATSSALLALHAILYSHARWGGRYFHDIESANAAEVLLSHYPQWVRACIVSLVLLKNVFRTSVSDNVVQRESGVWDGQELSFDDEPLIRALAALAARIWNPNRDGHHALPVDLVNSWRPRLAAALSLVAQCYDARIGIAAIPSAYEKLQDSLVKELRNAPDQPLQRTLVVFEFGHYVFDEHSASKRAYFAEHLLHKYDQRPDILWISLNRYWALHHGPRIGEANDVVLRCLEAKPIQDQPACVTKNAVNVRFHFLDLDSKTKVKQAAAYRIAFGVDQGAANLDVWGRLKSVFDRLREARNGVWHRQGVPWAYVTRALEILAHIYPDDFFTLRVEHPQPMTACSPSLAGPQADPPKNFIALPRIVPKQTDLMDSIHNRNWRSPKLLVTRALAALLINQRMTFGNSRQLVQVEEQSNDSGPKLAKLAEDWLKIAELIAEKDNHRTLLSYLDVFGSLPVDPVQPPPSPKPGDRPQRYVLGVDIGGGNVKVAVYEYSSGDLGQRIFRDNFSHVDLRRGLGKDKYDTVEQFVEQLDSCAATTLGHDKCENIKTQLAAIGVTWPGAIGGEPSHERVRAWSKIVAQFKGYCGKHETLGPGEKYFWEANAQELHEQFKVREAFAKRFYPKMDQRHAPVTLMNDGDAHVLHALASGPAAPVRQDIVVLAAGSGTAMGAVDAAGRLLDLLAEAGKVIVDIGGELGNGEFPSGTGGSMFSKETLSDLAKEVLTAWGIPDPPACFTHPLFIGYLLEKDKSKKDELNDKWKKEQNMTLENCAHDLGNQLDSMGKKNPQQFAGVVADRMGQNLADLVALTTELFGARVVYAAGGPMSGATGERVVAYAKDELEDRYGFHVVANDNRVPGAPHHLARLLKLTPVPSEADAFSGAHGAAVHAADLLRQRPLVEIR